MCMCICVLMYVLVFVLDVRKGSTDKLIFNCIFNLYFSEKRGNFTHTHIYTLMCGVYIFAYIYKYTHTHTHIYTLMCGVYIFAYIYKYTHTRARTHTHTHTHTHTYIYIYIYPYMDTCMCECWWGVTLEFLLGNYFKWLKKGEKICSDKTDRLFLFLPHLLRIDPIISNRDRSTEGNPTKR